MKKVLGIFSLFVLLSCSNNGGESGAVDDGIGVSDSNGALPDNGTNVHSSQIDTTSFGDNRVDTEKRDSTSTNPDQRH
jgi:hypothetical protein